MRRRLHQFWRDLKHLKWGVPRLAVRPTDVFVVSWPRSGNTWMRHLLFNSLYPQEQWDLTTLADAMPAISDPRLAQLLPALEGRPLRLFKSHDPAALYCLRGRVIYVVRDGRDAIASFHHYRQKLNHGQQTFGAYLQMSLDGRFRYGPWHEHVQGWLSYEHHPSLLVVRYEDMLADPLGALGRVLHHLRIELPPERLEGAVQRSGVKSVHDGFRKYARQRNKSFAGGLGGGSGRYREVFDDACAALFTRRAGAVMAYLGYPCVDPVGAHGRDGRRRAGTCPLPAPSQPARDRTFSFRSGANRFWVNEHAMARSGLPVDRVAMTKLLPALLAGTGQLVATLKEDARSLVQMWELEGRRWVIKRYRASAWRTAAHHLVRHSPAWREWHNARRLRRLQARVVDVLALVHDRRFGRWDQALVTACVDGPNLQQWLRRQSTTPRPGDGGRRRRTMAAAMGAQFGALAARGYVNRDHKAANLLIDRACAQDGAAPLIVDSGRLERKRSDRVAFVALALLAWTAREAGPISLREQLTCLRAVLAADDHLGRGRPRRLRHAALSIGRRLAAYRGRAAPKQGGEQAAARGEQVATP